MEGVYWVMAKEEGEGGGQSCFKWTWEKEGYTAMKGGVVWG